MDTNFKSYQLLLVMGVAGAGKSTIGHLLAEALGWDFFDGDDFHPPQNVAKMAQGLPLSDADRLPWLQAMRRFIAQRDATQQPAVIAASVLKQQYRDLLMQQDTQIALIYLQGDFDTIYARMQQRQQHFMKAEMLQSQFDALEEPESAWKISIQQSPTQMVAQILEHLRKH